MCLLVVVFTKTKRVYRHTADIHISSTTCWVLLAIRHENDAGDAAALVLAAGLEAAFHVGVAVSTQFFFDDFLELFLGGPGHDPQRALPVSFCGEGDDGEAIHGAEFTNDEHHGCLQLVKLRSAHASADVQDSHEVQPRALGGGRRVDDLQQHLLPILLQWRLVVAVRHQPHSVADLLD